MLGGEHIVIEFRTNELYQYVLMSDQGIESV